MDICVQCLSFASASWQTIILDCSLRLETSGVSWILQKKEQECPEWWATWTAESYNAMLISTSMSCWWKKLPSFSKLVYLIFCRELYKTHSRGGDRNWFSLPTTEKILNTIFKMPNPYNYKELNNRNYSSTWPSSEDRQSTTLKYTRIFMGLQSSWQTIRSRVEIRGLRTESRANGGWNGSKKTEAGVVLHDLVYCRAFQKL